MSELNTNKDNLTKSIHTLTNTKSPSYVQEVGKQAKDIALDRYPPDGRMNGVVDIMILIASLGALAVSILTYARVLLAPIKDVLSYLTLDDIKEIKLVELLLYDFIKLTGCDRVCIGLFHNGSSVGKYHFRKMSVAYETLASEDVPSLRDKFSDINLLKIEKEILLSSSYKFSRFSVDDANINKKCAAYLSDNGIHTVFTRLLVSRKKGIYGILELQYSKAPEFDILNTKEVYMQLEYIYEEVSKMVGYVTNNVKVNPMEKLKKVLWSTTPRVK